jgi:hypothetical protein
VGAKADPENGTIRIPLIRSEAACAVALHEIGHIRCRHLDNLDDLGPEDAAREVIAEASSTAAGMGGASGWAGGTDGESARRTTVLGGGRCPASSGFAETVGCINQ